MNILNKVTFQYLKENRTRTIVTIIGVILSTSLICALTTFTSSMVGYLQDNYKYSEGNWHGSQLDSNIEEYNTLKEDDEVDQITFIQQIGYAKDSNITTTYKPYLYVLGIGEESDDLLPIHLTEGKYPTNSSEIILPESINSSGFGNYSLNQTITLDLGKRYAAGEPLNQAHPYVFDDQDIEEETLQVEQTRTYTIVGFYERMGSSVDSYDSPAFPSLTVRDETSSTDTYDIYYRLKNPQKIDEFNEKYQLTGKTNRSLLQSYFVIHNDNIISMFSGLLLIVLALIMIGAITLIYNAFSISVSERTKQFGLLSSLGATKKQLKNMVIFEAFLISAIGIPIGIIIGIAGIGLTLFGISDKLINIGFPIAIQLSVSWISVVGAILIALITVLISAYIPSLRATKVNPIEAIRQTQDIQIKQKQVRISRFTKKFFGLPGILSAKYYKRNKKKYRATVFSLFISIVLFVGATSFTDYLSVSANGTMGSSEYDISYFPDQKINEEEITKKLSNATGVTNAAYKIYDYTYFTIDKDDINNESRKDYESLLDLTMQKNDSTYYGYGNFEFIDDDTFKQVLKDNNLNESKYFDKSHVKALVIDKYSQLGSDNKYHSGSYLNNQLDDITVSYIKEFEGYQLIEITKNEDGTFQYHYRPTNEYGKIIDGEEVVYSESEVVKDTTVSVGKVLENRPFFSEYSANITYYLPYSMRDVFVGQDQYSSAMSRCYFTSSNHTKTFKEMKEILESNQLSTNALYDYAEEMEQNRNLIFIVKVFAYGFIILISLIAATNVFNTISTNFNLRRREFAMLKSIGMDQKSFNRMMNYECILYGFRALLYGLPVSLLVSYLLFQSTLQGYELEFIFPYKSMGIATLCVFIVVFLSMLYSMKKIKKENPIDVLKNENL